MTKASFKGKDLTLILNNYRLYRIAEDLGVKTPAEAIESINEVLTRGEGEVISTSGMKGFVTIFRNMAEEGAERTKKPLPQFTESEWFDILSDEASQAVVEEFFEFLPPLETQQPKKKTKAKG